MSVNEIMAGAALGLALQVLHEAIKRAKDRSSTTRSILDRLDTTISRITPLVVQLEKLSEEVEDSTRKVIEDLKNLLKKAVLLVDAYAELRPRNLFKKYRYMRRIKELEVSLRWMVEVDVQVNQSQDIKELMAKMSEMNTKLDEIMRQPSGCPSFKESHSMPQSTNQNIVEEIDRSPEENDECLRDGFKPQRLLSTFHGVQENRTKFVRSDSL